MAIDKVLLIRRLSVKLTVSSGFNRALFDVRGGQSWMRHKGDPIGSRGDKFALDSLSCHFNLSLGCQAPALRQMAIFGKRPDILTSFTILKVFIVYR